MTLVNYYGKNLPDGDSATVKSSRGDGGELSRFKTDNPCPTDELAKAAEDLLRLDNKDILKKIGFTGNQSLGPDNAFSSLLADITGSIAGDSPDSSNDDKNKLVEMLTRSITSSLSLTQGSVPIVGESASDFLKGLQGSTISPNISIGATGPYDEILKKVRNQNAFQGGLSAGNFLGSQVSKAADSAGGLLALGGLTMFNDPRSVFDIAQDAFANLGTIFVDKNQIMDDIDNLIDKILEEVKAIDETWFKTKKRDNLLKVIELLKESDTKFGNVKGSLLSSGIFKELEYQAGTNNLSESEEILRRFKIEVNGELVDSGVAHIKIISYIFELRANTDILETRENFINEAVKNIDDFNFEIQADVDLTPDENTPLTKKLKKSQAQLISRIQQEIKALVKQMEPVTDSSDLIKLLTLSRLWAIQVKIILKLSKLIGNDIDDYLRLDPDDFKFDFNVKKDFLDDFDFPDTSPLIEKLREYIRLTNRRLTFDVQTVLDFPDVKAAGELAYNLTIQSGGSVAEAEEAQDKALEEASAAKAEEITKQIEVDLEELNIEIHTLIDEEKSSIDDIQNKLSGKLGADTGKILKIQRMMKNAGFDRATDILCKGSLTGFLNLTAQKVTQSGNLIEKLNCVLASGLTTSDGENSINVEQSADIFRIKRFTDNKNRAQSIGKPSFTDAFNSSRDEGFSKIIRNQQIKNSVDKIISTASSQEEDINTRNSILGS